MTQDRVIVLYNFISADVKIGEKLFICGERTGDALLSTFLPLTTQITPKAPLNIR